LSHRVALAMTMELLNATQSCSPVLASTGSLARTKGIELRRVVHPDLPISSSSPRLLDPIPVAAQATIQLKALGINSISHTTFPATLVRDQINVAAFDAWLGSAGPWAPIAYVIPYAVGTVAFVPGMIFAAPAKAEQRGPSTASDLYGADG
jgi:hypothetical protein